jgi:cytochrome c oxidase assembly protein subunit 11
MSARPALSRNTRTALASLALVGAMLTLGFASKPLYDTFCRITGFGGTTRIATAAPARVVDRPLSVRFDSNVIGVPLRFTPQQGEIAIRPGENALIFYTVVNTSDKPVIAHASYNVTPHKMGPFFAKLECFCFEDRVFAPGESTTLPVIFHIDPAMDGERSLKDVRTLTLTYTFFEATTPLPSPWEEAKAEAPGLTTQSQTTRP